ncbi:hypothetical protein C2845_PM06G30640 [Panicum miliaceum]|uniref:Uncharacterized protein n=1 Tax=Panicum miliaceum TaxID=4540 RepID=A0A3L6R9Y7_PANMI|nr:hypothetical protein C2845_PM06G30640 [Panicum miliaceum]
MAGRQKNTGASASAMAAALLLILLLPVGLPTAAAAHPTRGDDVQDPRPQPLGVYPPLKGHLPPARRAYAAASCPPPGGV